MKEAASIIKDITALVSEWDDILINLSDEIVAEPRNKQNRTIKQILGHMIDSASNNIHRIVHLQYQPVPLVFPNYATLGNNDRWIAIQDYQNEDWTTLVQLWKYSNLHFCHIINNINDDKLNNEWIAGPDQKITLKSMVIDYPRHLKLHLAEISDLINKNS